MESQKISTDTAINMKATCENSNAKGFKSIVFSYRLLEWILKADRR